MNHRIRKAILLMIVLFVSACSHKKEIPDILQNKFEVRTLPDDLSTPAIDLNKNHRKDILVLLHNKFTPVEIKEYFKLSENNYNLCINDLFGEGLIKIAPDGEFVPSCMVINSDEGNKIKNKADSLGKEMCLIAVDRMEKIKDAYQKIPAFKNIPFDDASFFILGNGVHNYWQLPYVSEKFIRADPPHRGVNRYYIAILENKVESESEPFDLFANRFQTIGNYIYGRYANRFSGTDSNITPDKLNELLKNWDSNVFVLDKTDQKKMSDLARIISNDLINYLEKNRTLFVKLYLNSGYKNQTSFREWFMWFYQFIITQANKSLIEKGYIKYPASQKAEFIITK